LNDLETSDSLVTIPVPLDLACVGRRGQRTVSHRRAGDTHRYAAAADRHAGADGHPHRDIVAGHGFMHGPAARLLIAEMIVDGRAKSLDVHQLRFSRFAEGDLVREHSVM